MLNQKVNTNKTESIIIYFGIIGDESPAILISWFFDMQIILFIHCIKLDEWKQMKQKWCI